MSETNGLPTGWAKAKVRELVSLINGFAFKPSQWKDTGLPIIRIQNLNNPEAEYNHCPLPIPEKFLVNCDDLLFAWSGTPGTSFGAHIWRGERAWLNQHIFKVTFDRSQIDARFLQLAINDNLNRYIFAAHGGAGLAHITKGKFEESELVLAPINEQRRIVAKIEELFSELDAGVAALQRVRTNLKRYRASVLKAAVEGKLTAAWRAKQRSLESASKLLERILAERRRRWEADQLAKYAAAGKPPPKNWQAKYAEPSPPDTTNLPELPAGGCWVSAEQMSDETRAITYGVIKLGQEVVGGVATLRSSNVRNLRLDLDGLKCIDPAIAAEFRRTILKGGELLVTVRGTLGGVVTVPDSCRGYNISREVAMIALVEHQTAPALAIAIASPPIQAWLTRNTRGIAYTGINIETLKELPIPLAPWAEQEQIVAEVEQRLSVLAATEAEIDASLVRAARLRQSILKRAFAGRLVPQDPTDEPASVLLERIKAIGTPSANHPQTVSVNAKRLK